MISFNSIPTTPTSLFSAYASFTTLIMLIRSMANELLPPQIQSYISSAIHYLFKPLNSNITLVIEEYCNMFSRNEVYEAAEIYLRTKINPSTQRLRINKTQKQSKLNISIEKGEEVKDNFDNVKLKWLLVYFEPNKFSGEKREFQLTFPKKFKDKVLNFYLPYVLSEANKIKQEERMVKIHTKRSSYGGGEEDDGCGGNQLWGCVNLDHPAKFETLAMDPEMKKKIVDDLDRFVRRREFYKRVGKAWKRGYLLFGPPGTGKSSLIAAMANYLKFDVYDLELSGIYNNAELRRTLLSTTNRSILVIEDVDCSVNMENRQSEDRGYHQNPASQPKFTLSGLLNFIDGLWSSCGDERIIVFTTNHKDKLDPALLRPGRMDMHIHMSYCTSQGFKTLATNYLGIDSYKHHLYKEIEVLIDSTEVTPAEIAEELMKNDDIDVGFGELVNFLKHKRIESDEKKVEDNQQEQKQVEEPIEPQEAKRVKTNRGKGVHMRRRFVRQ